MALHDGVCWQCLHREPHRYVPALNRTVCEADGCECPGEKDDPSLTAGDVVTDNPSEQD